MCQQDRAIQPHRHHPDRAVSDGLAATTTQPLEPVTGVGLISPRLDLLLNDGFALDLRLVIVLGLKGYPVPYRVGPRVTSPSQRQSDAFLVRVRSLYRAAGRPPDTARESGSTVEFVDGSRPYLLGRVLIARGAARAWCRKWGRGRARKWIGSCPERCRSLWG